MKMKWGRWWLLKAGRGERQQWSASLCQLPGRQLFCRGALGSPCPQRSAPNASQFLLWQTTNVHTGIFLVPFHLEGFFPPSAAKMHCLMWHQWLWGPWKKYVHPRIDSFFPPLKVLYPVPFILSKVNSMHLYDETLLFTLHNVNLSWNVTYFLVLFFPSQKKNAWFHCDTLYMPLKSMA